MHPPLSRMLVCISKGQNTLHSPSTEQRTLIIVNTHLTFGAAVQRRSDAAGQRRSGAAAQRRSGAAAQRRSGAAAQRRSGAAAQRRSGAAAQRRSGAAAQGLELHTLSTKRTRIPVSNLGQVIYILHYCSSLSCMNEYLAIDSGGYLCTNCLRALFTAWLNAVQRS